VFIHGERHLVLAVADTVLRLTSCSDALYNQPVFDEVVRETWKHTFCIQNVHYCEAMLIQFLLLHLIIRLSIVCGVIT